MEDTSHLSNEHKEKIGNALRGNKNALGRKNSDETKEKIRIATKQHWKNRETRKRMIRGLKLAWKDPVRRKQRTKTMIEVMKTEEMKEQIRKKVKESWADPENYAKRSGENAMAWRGGVSFEPYCKNFNNKIKERIREEFGRKCMICGKEENEERLHVHHCDYNKGQGCGQKWSLIPLCRNCHTATNHNRWYWFNLLSNNWVFKHGVEFS